MYIPNKIKTQPDCERGGRVENRVGIEWYIELLKVLTLTDEQRLRSVNGLPPSAFPSVPSVCV